MPSKAPVLYPRQARLLAELGRRLKQARLRRRLPATLVAERADISRQTVSKVERGDASVTMGTYLRVLVVLNLEGDLAQVALDDSLGRRLQDAGLETPRRVRKPQVAGPLLSGADDPGAVEPRVSASTTRKTGQRST